MYKLVISVWAFVHLSVLMSEYSSETPGPICLTFLSGNSVEPREY